VNELPPSARLVGIGFYIALCIVLGTLGGRALDGWLETGKLFTVAGLAVGLALGLWGGFRQLMEVLALIDARRAEGKRRE
jgi:hypothetical protein